MQITASGEYLQVGRPGIRVGIGRMLLVCKSELRQELCLKADSVCRLHETLIALIRPGIEFYDISTKF